MLSHSCPGVEGLALYLDDRLDAEQRRQTEEHLSNCAECRDRLGELHASRRGSPPPHRAPESLKRAARAIPHRGVGHSPTMRWRPYLAMAAALVAAVGLAALLYVDGTRRPPRPSDPGVLREGAESSLFRALAPSGAIPAPPAVEFRWSASAGTRRYVLTVLDGLGNIVHRQSTPAERLELAPEVSLEPGTAYFWYVSAELEDGTELQSEIIDFILR